MSRYGLQGSGTTRSTGCDALARMRLGNKRIAYRDSKTGEFIKKQEAERKDPANLGAPTHSQTGKRYRQISRDPPAAFAVAIGRTIRGLESHQK